MEEAAEFAEVGRTMKECISKECVRTPVQSTLPNAVGEDSVTKCRMNADDDDFWTAFWFCNRRKVRTDWAE